MTDELKAPEAPVVIPEAPADESLIDNRRTEIEKLVITANNTFPEPEAPETPEPLKAEEKKEEPKAEVSDPVERIKNSVQKRIDKVIAQKKTVEEENAELRAELERLKANSKPTETSTPKDDTPPTPEQVEAYIAKMQEEGNHKEAAAAIRYLVKLEKEEALKKVKDEQDKAQKEAEAQKVKIDADMKALANDYVVYDEKGQPDINSDLTLANQKGLLFKTAISLYNDKELHRDFYNDPDVVSGFRRAVADAYREIHQQGLINKTPKGETVITEKRTPRVALADPSAEVIEETPAQSNSNSLSDAEKVREEIRARNKNRFLRKIPQ